MVEVGEKCKECVYWSRRTESCDYRLITGASRTITNNIRIDPVMCDKFKEGTKKYDGHDWKNGRYVYERDIQVN